MTRQRTPRERHEAWLRWRRKGAATYGDVCTCKVGASPSDRFKRTTCCVECECGARIIKAKLYHHQRECVAHKEFEELLANLKPGDEFVVLRDEPGVVRGPHWEPCVYCKRPVRDRLTEWHWRNNCERFPGKKKNQQEEGDVPAWLREAAIHAADQDPGSSAS